MTAKKKPKAPAKRKRCTTRERELLLRRHTETVDLLRQCISQMQSVAQEVYAAAEFARGARDRADRDVNALLVAHIEQLAAEKASAAPKTYVHTPKDRGKVELVPRSHSFACGFDEATRRE